MYTHEDMRIKLQRWALLAQVIVSVHLNHERRAERVGVLGQLIMEAARPNGSGNYGTDPVWALTLLSLLNFTRFEHHEGPHSYIDHRQAKDALRLFIETCYFFIENWDNQMMTTNFHKKSEDITKPRYRYGFVPDATDSSLDDIPFGAGDDDLRDVDAFNRFVADLEQETDAATDDTSDVFTDYLRGLGDDDEEDA